MGLNPIILDSRHVLQLAPVGTETDAKHQDFWRHFEEGDDVIMCDLLATRQLLRTSVHEDGRCRTSYSACSATGHT